MIVSSTSVWFSAHRTLRDISRLSVIGLLGLACSTYRPADDGVDRGAHVAIELRRPTTVAVLTSARDTLLMPGIVELRGNIDWATSDTVYLRLSGASVRSGVMQRVPVNGLVALARTSDIMIQRRELNAGRTAVLILGATAVAAALLAAYLGIVFARSDGY